MKTTLHEKNGYEYTTTELDQGSTERGFSHMKFMDRYGQECSMQHSSLANESSIWLGVDNTGKHLTGPSGKTNEQVSARMHLTQAMVKQLLPYLTAFAKTGDYTQVKKKAPKAKKKASK